VSLLRADQAGLDRRAAAEGVGVSLNCESLWFIDAGRMSFVETPISPRFLSQDDRVAIADGSPGASRLSRSQRGSGSVIKPSIASSPGTAKSTDATSPGSRTTRPTCGDKGQAASICCR